MDRTSSVDNYTADICEVCLLTPRSAAALVPCGYARSCAAFADAVTNMGNGCPLCIDRPFFNYRSSASLRLTD